MRKATIAAASFIVLLSTSSSQADKRVREPTLDDLAAVWVGGAQEGFLEFCRLELTAAGTGLLTVQYLAMKPAVAYRVTFTRLSTYDVQFGLEPLDANAEPVFLRGQAVPNRLELNLGGSERKWKRLVILQKHEQLMARLRAVTERAERWTGDT